MAVDEGHHDPRLAHTAACALAALATITGAIVVIATA